MDLLGRGNYGTILYYEIGSAFLVQSKTDNQLYVAKKMVLEGLS